MSARTRVLEDQGAKVLFLSQGQRNIKKSFEKRTEKIEGEKVDTLEI